MATPLDAAIRNGQAAASTPLDVAQRSTPAFYEPTGTQPALTRGLRAGVRNTTALSKNYVAALLDAAGNRDAAADWYRSAHEDSLSAAQAAPKVNAWRDVHGVSDLAEYVQGQAGAMAPMVTPAVLGGTTAAALRAGHGLRTAASMAPLHPVMAGGVIERLNSDPATAGLPAAEKWRVANLEGAAGAGIQALPLSAMAGRAFGAPGLAAKATTPIKSLRNAAMDTGVGAASMGVGNVAVGELGRTVQRAYNPDYMPMPDNEARMEEFASGVAGGLPIATPHAVLAHTVGADIEPAVRGGKALSKGAVEAGKAAAPVVDSAIQRAIDAAPKSLDEAALTIGRGAADIMNRGEDSLTRIVAGGKDADVDTLLRPQGRDPKTMMEDDIAKHEAVQNLSGRLPENTPQYVHDALAQYEQSGKDLDSWRPVADAVASWKRTEVLDRGMQEFKDEAALAAGKGAAKAVKFAEDIKNTYNAERRANAQEVKPDAFDRVLSDALLPHTGLKQSDDILTRLPQITKAMRQWMEADMPFVPRSLRKMFNEPAQAVEQTYDLMRRQGLVDEALGERVKEVVGELQSRKESTKDVGSIIEGNLLPTAQAEHQFSGAQHEELGHALLDALARGGKLPEKELDTLFGQNKEPLLEALRRKLGKQKGEYADEERGVTRLSDEEVDPLESGDSAAYEERAQITNPMDPNVVGENVRWHHYNEGKGEPYDILGQIIDKKGAPDEYGDLPLKGSHDKHAEIKAGDLKTTNNANVRRQGYFDYIRERFAGSPEEILGRSLKFLEENQHLLPEAERAKPEAALNKRFFVLREDTSTDRGEPFNVPHDEFRSLTPGSRDNKWAEHPGKDNEYGDVAHGKIWLERADGTRFATSAARIIKRMIAEGKKEGLAHEEHGLAGQRALLMQGLSSLLSSKDAEGHYALTGRVGFMEKPKGGIKWGGKGIPDNLRMLSAEGRTLKDATEAVKVERLDETRRIVRESLNELKHQLKDAEGEQAAKLTKEVKRLTKALAEDDVRALELERDRAEAMKEARRGENDKPREMASSEETALGKTVHVVDRDDNGHLFGSRRQAENYAKQGDRVAKRGDHWIIERDIGTQHRVAVEKPLETMEMDGKDEGVRSHDEATGEELHPHDTGLSPVRPDEKQVSWLMDKLRKGVPAFNEGVKKLSPEQRSAMSDVLNKMVEAKSPDAPIWRGEPPKNFEEFAKRARLALKELSAVREEVRAANEQTPFGNVHDKPLSSEDRAKFVDDAVRRLGPDIKASLVEDLQLDGKTISGDWMPGVIRASLRAADVHQVGAHEAFHEFFHRLTEGGKEAGRVAKILLQAAETVTVKRQLERLLIDHPEALKQLSDPAERLAYMFQFHQASLLKLGPETKTTFQKISDFFRKVVGLLSNDQKAENILQAFDAGKMQTADAAAEVLAKNIEARENMIKAVNAKLKPVTEKATRLLGTAATNLDRTGNPELKKVRREFKLNVGEDGEGGFLDAKDHQLKLWSNKLAKAFDGIESKDLELASRFLRSGEKTDDKVTNEVVGKVRGILDEFHKYLNDAEVKRFDEESGAWVLMGHLKDYYPQAYDTAKLITDPGKFIEMMKQYNAKELEAIARKANEELANGGSPEKGTASFIATREAVRAASEAGEPRNWADYTKEITVDDVAQAITNRIISSFGQKDIEETSSAIGFSPFMRAINRRSLKWLAPEIMAEFGDNDMARVMTSYLAQGVKRAEYVRKFGNGGEKLQDSMNKARTYELDKAVADQYGIEGASKKVYDNIRAIEKLKGEPPTFEEGLVKLINGHDPKAKVAIEDAAKLVDASYGKLKDAAKDVMAMEGTLGYDINPKLRRFENSLLVYQNMRTMGLSLFSQFIDPLGIMVRGGTMHDAWNAYMRGMKEVWSSWKGEHTQDEAAKIAEQVGTVDAHGFLAGFGQLYSSMFMGGKFRKANDMLFRINGMEGFNRGMQISATQAAINFIKRHATEPGKHSAEYLKELNLTAKDVKVGKDGNLDYTDPKIQTAIHRWVNGSILRPNAGQRPAWASDPHYMVFWHMKQFAYTFHDTILKRAMHEVSKHDDLGPAAVLVAAYTPMMIASDAAKAILLTGEEPAWMKAGLPSMIEHGAMRVGLTGRYQPLTDTAVSGRSWLGLAGPSVEQLGSVFTHNPMESLGQAVPGASVINTMRGNAHAFADMGEE